MLHIKRRGGSDFAYFRYYHRGGGFWRGVTSSLRLTLGSNSRAAESAKRTKKHGQTAPLVFDGDC